MKKILTIICGLGLLAGGCGDTNGRPGIGKTDHLMEAYEFGKRIYKREEEKEKI